MTSLSKPNPRMDRERERAKEFANKAVANVSCLLGGLQFRGVIIDLGG